MDPFTPSMTAAQFRYITAFEAERAARAEWHAAAATLREADADLGPAEAALIDGLLGPSDPGVVAPPEESDIRLAPPFCARAGRVPNLARHSVAQEATGTIHLNP
jgi:hypothetical protein